MGDKKYLIRPEDRINAPVPEMGKIRREMIVDASTAGTEVLTFANARYEPRATGKAFEKKHSHPNAEEVAYIISGRGMAGVDDQEFEVKAGDSIWVPRGTVHWFHNPFDEPWEMVFAYSKPSLKETGLEVVE